MQILFNLAFSQFYLYNLDNGARCTETSVSFTYISCFMNNNNNNNNNNNDVKLYLEPDTE